PWTDQLIEREAQDWRVRRVDERGLREHAQPNDGASPGRGIVRAAARCLPQDRSSRIRERARERAVDAHESVGDELFNLRGGERAYVWRVAVHEVSPSHEGAHPGA